MEFSIPLAPRAGKLVLASVLDMEPKLQLAPSNSISR